MRVAVVENADREAAREAAAQTLARAGAHVHESTHTHVRFRGWRPRGEFSFARTGYVGFHGHAGEKDLELRVVARAAAPRRALVLASVVALAAALALYAFQPPPGVWIVAAAVLWPIWIAALVADLGARRADRESETSLFEGIVEALRAESHVVRTEDEERRRRFERDLEGELVERRLKQAKRGERPRFLGGGRGKSP